MAEFKPWLEMELASQFSPARAPEGLWEKIESSAVVSADRTRPRNIWADWVRVFAWPAFAAVALLLSAGVFWEARSHVRDMAQLSNQDLRVVADASTGVVICSDNPRQIRNWLKDQANIEVEAPTGLAGPVRVLGAKLVRLPGSLIATVAYHMESAGDSATLLVSRKRSSFWAGSFWPEGVTSRAMYNRLTADWGANRNPFSGNPQDQNFSVTMAGLNENHGACHLCHVDLHGRL